jgi:hypothetical protein
MKQNLRKGYQNVIGAVRRLLLASMKASSLAANQRSSAAQDIIGAAVMDGRKAVQIGTI